MRKICSIGPLLAVCLFSGCTVGPQYHRPAAAPPPAFRGADSVPAADAASLADLPWFQVFKDEQLQQLVRTALVQ
ncbi:MAG: transporter, partial [Acidobacteriota bacterium]